ncbi:probable inactive DNA (cytosine-5)-methyltransferase DRM3 [Morus notabilis]|uniref:probable inactive DNA (cytosine-5)-methyltransferase DRM3 n=1 Tax=Morus notabilis TaxID=981085 RepID=UPI000CECF440|nr:probable inactive DNA (cytosine-5)-methyltransferase DRM3 [Morus notabilis]XP_024022910.1 probable inactive DNA (cytosine-5)-methyltransferase DRM3 [Morus notabilis]
MKMVDQEREKPLVPKEEVLDFDFPPQTMLSGQFGENFASSSGSNLRSSLIGMGFLPALVDKVIEEKGVDDVDLLVDALVAYSAPQRSNSESSDSLDSLFDDKDESSPPEIPTFIELKEEPDILDDVDDGKRASLQMMNFSLDEINFAIDKLGENTPIDELVDFIVAAQIAKRLEEERHDIVSDAEERNEDTNNETLFGTMDKTLHLLEMGFSEAQVSWAIENVGSEAPISELADSIFTGRTPVKPSISTSTSELRTASNCRSFALGAEGIRRDPLLGSAKVETSDLYPDTVSQSMDFNAEQRLLGKRPKQELSFDTVPPFGHIDYEDNQKGKRPKEEYDDDSSSLSGPTWLDEKMYPEFTECEMPRPFDYNPRRSLSGVVARPPYFFYGNVGTVCHESWVKISKFLYNLEPEFVNTRFFSALSRKEGYIHNLPTENRSQILPKPPMTIEEVMPRTKKWWPAWDARKQLSCISSEVNGIPQLCARLQNTIASSHGLLSSEQQRNILHHCRSLNLVWVGPNKLAPLDPEYLEIILGYPSNHTQAFISLIERLQSLRYCFQTDTLGYYLSVLKSIYPNGLTVLSIFSGIGGAEVAFHRLGIHLKAVVSVETSETKRGILKKWWQSTGQTGELIQIEDIQKLTSSKLSSFMNNFGGFDFIICQNSFTHSPNSKVPANVDSISGFDFSLFCEFVRILQRVRTMSEKKR